MPSVDARSGASGAGVSATANGASLIVGTRRLMKNRELQLRRKHSRHSNNSTPPDKHRLLDISQEGVVLGVIGAFDTLRPEAAKYWLICGRLASPQLHFSRATVWPRRGPSRSKCQLSGVHAELLRRKAESVSSLHGFRRRRHQRRSALARAGVGIAIGGRRGTDIAAEAGDIIMMGEPLRPLPLLLKLLA